MITIKRAIEVLEGDEDFMFDGEAQELVEAKKLGVEALKAVKVYRRIYPLSTNDRLPGEAEE